METTQFTPSPTRTHPLILAAAGSVLVLSLTAAASIAGWLPSHRPGATPEPATSLTTQAQAPAMAAPTTSVVVNVPPAAPAKAAPAAKKVSHGETAAERPAPLRKASATPAVFRESDRDLDVIDATPAARPAPVQVAETCRDCGVVEAVNEIPVESSGKVGAVAGGIVGAIIGNQIGNGSTRGAARVLGAAAGAYAGHQIEKANNREVRYEVVVRYDDGTTDRIESATRPHWRVGDKVRYQNGELAQRS